MKLMGQKNSQVLQTVLLCLTVESWMDKTSETEVSTQFCQRMGWGFTKMIQ